MSPNLKTKLCQLARDFLRQQPLSRNATPEEALKLTNLTGLEAVGPSEDLNQRLLNTGISVDVLADERQNTLRTSLI